MPLPESETFNIEFVRTVKLYRCLYDASLPEYNSKDEQDRAWSLVADKFSATAADCKVRWKYLRGGLTRYIKKLKAHTGPEDKQCKEFYMWKDMQFLIPYLKSRSYTSRLHPLSPGVDGQHPYEIKRELDDMEDSHFIEDSFIESPTVVYNVETDFPSLSARGVKRTAETTNEFTDSSAPMLKSAKFVTKTENPDLDFFRSILPDMAELNPSQKRRFKLKVLMFLEDMCNEGKSAARPSSASPAHSNLST